MRKSMFAALAAVIGLVGLSASARAQEQAAVNIGTVDTPMSCSYFRNYEGSRLAYSESEYARWWGAAAARRYYAAHTTWRSWVVKDCQSNFQTLRHSLEAALASSGRITTGPGGYTLNITISDIGETAPANNQPVRGENSYRTSWGTAVVTASYTLLDRSGATIDGGMITKRVEMSRTLDTNRIRVNTYEPGESVYDLVQSAVAKAIARDVVFAIDPVIVTAVEGNLIEINYGQPLVALGDRLDVDRSRGIGSLRYRVISATNYSATAEVDGDSDTSDIDPGNEVTFVEGDSDAANARRYRRVPLP